MPTSPNAAKTTCAACRDGKGLDFEITMAFQPIVDAETGRIFAHEALVRGPNQESAYSILSQVTDDNRYAFDQACRVTAIELAASLGMRQRLSINFLPNAVYEPANCIRATLEAAKRTAFPIERILFEVTEAEKIDDEGHLTRIMREYQKQGFMTAIDDFGAGYAGLNLLCEFQPDIIKLDMMLTRDIHAQPVRQAIVEGVLLTANKLGLAIIAEGVETKEEFDWLRAAGIHLFQGFLLARPAFRSLHGDGDITWP